MQVRTVKDALNHPNISLVKLKLGLVQSNPQQAETILNAFISSIVTDLVLFFNVGKTMNVPQVNQVVEFIKTEYYYLKPSELKYCFDNAKMGKYGQLYDRIDGTIIFDWIEKFLQERLEFVISERQQELKNIKLNGTEQTIFIQNIITDSRFVANKQQTIKSDTNTPNEEIKRRNQTEQEILIQDILREFDVLHRELDFEIASKQSIRMIQYNGKQLTQDKFLEIRLEEMELL